MEGTLEIREGRGPLARWSPKYFISSNNTMVYCDKRGGKVEARIHLEIVTLNKMNDCDDQFKLIAGSETVTLKAGSRDQKQQWINAM